MIASPHLAAGAVISKLISRFSGKRLFFNLILSFSLGLTSHFLMDMVPHTEYVGLFGREFLLPALIIDLIFVLFPVYFLGIIRPDNNGNNYILLAGLVGSILPDIPKLAIKILKFNMPWLNRIINFIDLFHADYQINYLFFGFCYQVILSVLLLLILKYLKTR